MPLGSSFDSDASRPARDEGGHHPTERRPAGSSPSSTAGWLGALERTSRIGADPFRVLPQVTLEGGERFGDAPALIGDTERFSHRELAARQNGYTAWALDQGLGKGDTVALLMPNRPEYLAVWLGLTRVGIVVALLNTNLSGASLAHCIAVAAPRRLIVAADLAERLQGAAGHLTEPPEIWVHGDGTSHRRIDRAVDAAMGAAASLPSDARPTLSDRALLIYTSGTTGLPKAAHVSHHRLMTWSFWFAGLLDIGPSDRMYDCLPLYHSIGGVVATGSLLVSGGSVVIREKFSASRFWSDVAEQDCTMFQYIGELCRYLANSPPHPLERAHRLRVCAGNGLRGDIWKRFQERFAVPRILEFYAATEGTVTLYNVEGKVGAVGRVPSFMAHRSPAAIVGHDVERGEPERGADGLCRRVAQGETGELIGRLAADPAQAAQRFEGYTSAAESDRKVLRGVFAPGDAWLRTGDLMRQDAKGFFYFVDRIGDTFRWKGENVATTEVAGILERAPGVLEATVYGVRVPGAEGRAGMAALGIGPDFDMAAFHDFCAANLPVYARPVFVRLCERLEVTETFKQKKAALVSEGFDPTRMDDALFVDDPARKAYVRLDATMKALIDEAVMRL